MKFNMRLLLKIFGVKKHTIGSGEDKIRKPIVLTDGKTTCIQCGAKIWPTTAEQNRGLCLSCYQRFEKISAKQFRDNRIINKIEKKDHHQGKTTGNKPKTISVRKNKKEMNKFKRSFRKLEVDKLDEDGFTKLWHASREGQVDIVRKLLTEGADVNRKCFHSSTQSSDDKDYYSTPLLRAAWRGHLNIVKILVENGANVNERDHAGRTPIFYSIWEGYTDIVQYLIENDGDINISQGYDYDGYNDGTPLMSACAFGRTDIVKILLDNGALVDKKMNRGITALDKAMEKGNKEILELLRNAGGVASSHGQEKAAFIAMYKNIRDASKMSRMEVIEKVREEYKSIPFETALIWVKIADLKDGIIRL